MDGHRDVQGEGAGVLKEVQAVQYGVGLGGSEGGLIGRGLTLTVLFMPMQPNGLLLNGFR